MIMCGLEMGSVRGYGKILILHQTEVVRQEGQVVEGRIFSYIT